MDSELSQRSATYDLPIGRMPLTSDYYGLRKVRDTADHQYALTPCLNIEIEETDIRS
jgi:hypothetical protein